MAIVPDDILDVLASLELEAALAPDDPRYVDTSAARGATTTPARLAMKFGLRLSDRRFVPPTKKHVLFFGHTGCGKTTELRRYCQQLEGPDAYLVVEVSVHEVLDRHNFEYTDLLMALAQALAQKLEDREVPLPDEATSALERWFAESVDSEERLQDFALEVKAGAEAKAGIPLLTNLFARVTAAFKTNVTYKSTLRHVIRNTYAQFTAAFNDFIRQAEGCAAESGVATRFLFVVDGTDKLRGEDQRRFFTDDQEQLLGIEAHVVYTAPLALKYEGNPVGGIDGDLFLPLITIADRAGEPVAAGLEAMHDLLLRRAAASLFEHGTVERLVQSSGGHPRELLRLLKLCCELADGPTISTDVVERAIAILASEYRRFLEPEDYAHLARIDLDPAHAGNDERTRRLLYNLALLEYNDGSWRHSHPVIAGLEGYELARAAYEMAGERP